MTGNVGPPASTSRKSVPLVANSACPSPHFPEDPGTSSQHIRFSTPPSSLCASSPELVLPPTSKRVRTRPETPSALAVLAAVCSSPNVRWDGVRHRYGDGHGKSIWCDELRMARGPPRQAHIVDPSSPSSHMVYGERSFPFQATIKSDIESYEVEVLQKTPANDDVRLPSSVEDEDADISPPKVTGGRDYFSEMPSSPPTLVFSSPYNGAPCDVSSSSDERSSTLPLSSPGPLHPTLFSPTYSIRDDAVECHSQNSSDEAVKTEHDTGFFNSTAEEEKYLIPLAIDRPKSEKCGSEAPTMDGEPIQTPPLSPLQALEPLPATRVNMSPSPLSSLVSSPLSELIEDEVSSPAPTRFSIISDAISSRSISPDTDIDSDYIRKSKAVGRRASAANVFGTKARRMSGLSGSRYWRRSDTAPPETTPSKRARQSSPSSPIPRPLQLRRLSSSPSPSSHSNDLATSSAMFNENRPGRKKHKKILKTRNPIFSEVKRSLNPSHPGSAAPHQPTKRRKGKLSNRVNQSESNATPSEFYSLSPAELTALPVTGFLVETLALSRASAITAPELLRAVLKSQPHLMGERSEKSWLELVRCVLAKVRMFGRIERRGTVSLSHFHSDRCGYVATYLHFLVSRMQLTGRWRTSGSTSRSMTKRTVGPNCSRALCQKNGTLRSDLNSITLSQCKRFLAGIRRMISSVVPMVFTFDPSPHSSF